MRKVKISTKADGQSGPSCKRRFDVVTVLPAAGKDYNGGKVKSVTKLVRDIPEDDQEETADLDCFRVGFEDDRMPEYVAISRTAGNHYQLVVRIHVLIPTVTEVNIIIAQALKKEENEELLIAKELKEVEDGEYVQKYFGISPERYETAIVSSSEIGSWNDLVTHKDFNKDIWAYAYGKGAVGTYDHWDTVLYAYVPYWWDDTAGMLEVSPDDIVEMLHQGLFPQRTLDDLHPMLFRHLVLNCEEAEDWRDVEGFPPYFHLISLNAREFIEITDLLTDICCGPFKNLLERAGISQAELSQRFFIGKRTVDEWCSGNNKCRIYLRLLLAEQLGLFRRRR